MISLWRSRESVQALNDSDSYRATVDALVETGVLTGEQSVEVLEVTGGHVDERITEAVT